MKLCQVNALIQGKKTETTKEVTDCYKLIQKEAAFDGLSRIYQPKDEEGEPLPSEEKKVQLNYKTLLELARSKWSELWDLVATQDLGNQQATADIKVNNTIILPGVPVTTLLFLEKQLTDVEAFITHMPTPDSAHDWAFDPNSNLLRNKQQESIRTKKVPKNHVKSPATDKHPAQVEVYMEDIPVGRWFQTLFTGRCPAQTKTQILYRVKLLKDAVKLAREEANTIKVEPRKISEPIFKFLLESQ